MAVDRKQRKFRAETFDKILGLTFSHPTDSDVVELTVNKYNVFSFTSTVQPPYYAVRAVLDIEAAVPITS